MAALAAQLLVEREVERLDAMVAHAGREVCDGAGQVFPRGEEALPSGAGHEFGVLVQEGGADEDVVEDEVLGVLEKMAFAELDGEDVALEETVAVLSAQAVEVRVQGGPLGDEGHLDEVVRVERDFRELEGALQHDRGGGRHVHGVAAEEGQSVHGGVGLFGLREEWGE